MSDFVHLHVHSEYSLLDGLPHPKDLVARAAELQQPALALTDHGAMFATIEFYDACKAKGIKPIIGIEAYLARRGMKDRDGKDDRSSYHLLLLAENNVGYQNLLKLVSAAELEGFYYYPRMDNELLARHSEGLICTTGCPSGQVPRLWHDGRKDEARKWLGWYKEVFKDRFYVELQEHGIAEFAGMNRELIELAREFDLPLIATNDAHYIRSEDAPAQDVLLCIQTGTTITDGKRMRMDGADYYLKSSDEMRAIWREVPHAIANTLSIAERCNVNLDFKGFHLPVFPLPDGFTPQTYLLHLCEQGFQKHFPNGNLAARERLEYELGVIHQMGFDTYFLIVWDLIRFAREANIWYNVRGSAAGSMAAYCAGITNLDPLEHRLIFERFLNPGRVTMPDIDLDFQDDRRAELIEYTVRKYGKDNVAQIITFGTLGAKAAIRDVGRALDYPLNEVDRVAKMIPTGPNVKLGDVLENVAEFKDAYESSDYIRRLIDHARLLEGVARNAGTHAAGVVVADRPIVEYAPLHRPTKGDSAGGFPVVQFEMNHLERVGLLKMDYLGLASLTVMRRACELIAQRHGKHFDLSNIPVEDPKAFDLFARGDVTGVFQVEGAGLRKMLQQMKPTKFAHIVAGISLYRPGPMAYIPDYISRLHGEQKIEYRHPKLETVLEETFGIIVYQEQIIQAAVTLAGYKPGEADEIRKAVGKKIKEKIEAHREKFVKGSVANGIDKAIAEAIYGDIEFFARYGFNKCLTADTRIVDADTGQWLTIGELFARQATCMTPSLEADLRVAPRAISAVQANGRKPVFRLRTRSGREIRATANHPFRTWEGWTHLDDLRPGDLIAAPRHIPYTPSTHLSDAELVVLAAALTEGNLCHPHSYYVYAKDEAYLADYIAHLERFANTVAVIDRSKSAAAVYAKRVNRLRPSAAVEFIQNAGLHYKKAIEKKIPAVVFGLPIQQLQFFLGRLWSADGCVHPKTRAIYYATSSRELARGLHHLLLRLGLGATLHTKRFKYRNSFRPGYTLNLLGGRDAARRFAERVGPYLVGHTRENLATLLADYEAVPVNRARGTVEIVPAQVQTLIRAEMVKQELTPTRFSQYFTGAERLLYQDKHKRGLRRDTLADIASALAAPTLRAHAESDIFWDEVIAIEPDGVEETYDLTVPGTHNFVANDLIVHNSHAANYAVLTCQTAYLKAYYPIEYATALLINDTGNAEKIGMLVGEVRRMGVDLVPPDVNTGDVNFQIAATNQAIHFGLSAIKNVSANAVQVIVDARKKGGAFKSLDDFCRRVDLRLVNRRVLESLIKAGALDQFGRRAQLLKVLDRMMAASQAAHQASDRGQLSMFGAVAAAPGLSADTFGTLPDEPEIPNRDKLAAEKELTGAYFSDNPLMRLAKSARRNVTHLVSQLDESLAKQSVTLAGVVTAARVITTKKGDPMAFVALEDPTGTTEITVFPKVFERTRDLWTVETLTLVRGKVELREGKLQVLCDSAEEYVLEDNPEDAIPFNRHTPATQYAMPDAEEVAQIENLPPDEFADMPPPPPEPPDEISEQWTVSSEQTGAANGAVAPPAKTNGNGHAPAKPNGNGNGNGHAKPAHAPAPPRAEPTRVAETPARYGPPKHLRIFFTRTNDQDEDLRRMRELLSLLASVDGRDRFTFYVRNPQGIVQLDFPNHSTNYGALQGVLDQTVSEWGSLEVQ